jgi:hypothetical protein
LTTGESNLPILRHLELGFLIIQDGQLLFSVLFYQQVLQDKWTNDVVELAVEKHGFYSDAVLLGILCWIIEIVYFHAIARMVKVFILRIFEDAEVHERVELFRLSQNPDSFGAMLVVYHLH